jgi:hypothetical protein
MRFRDVVRQLVACLRERNHESQVEQQLQRGDRTMRVARIPAEHSS